MRKQLVEMELKGLTMSAALDMAREQCPWVAYYRIVEGGVMCFESSTDVELWDRTT